MIGPKRWTLRGLIRRADQARDERRYGDAATLYLEALALAPDRPGLHIQRAHALKETGQFALAEHHYLEAKRLRPEDGDLALQLGHFHKAAGRPAEALAAYAEATRLRPGWDEPARELQRLRERGWGGADREHPAPAEFARGRPALAGLVPEIAPRPPQELLRTYEEQVRISSLGRRERGAWGNRRTLRGIEAVRGYCLSETPIVDIQLLLDGVLFHRGRPAGAYPLKLDAGAGRLEKHVFNLWVDFTHAPGGLHSFEIRCIDAGGRPRSAGEDIVIAPALAPEDYPMSHLPVRISEADPRPLEEQIRMQPSMVHPAARALFPEGVRSILVMRVDQLGDMVASIPALRRLRELAPRANIVGLFSPANADLARTLRLVDEIIVADFPDDPVEERRLMSLEAQEALRQRLAPHRFDIAVDLARAAISRELLLLSGATFLYGTGGGDWPWLSADFHFDTYDRWNRHDFTPHSAKVLALIESLGTLLGPSAPIIRRTDLARDVLEPLGIGADDRFAVLHAGARIGFSRWPHFGPLARMILAETDLKVVMMAEDTEFRETLPQELFADSRFLFFGERLPFDAFDAFLSFATVMIGNDSGPKHLASLRGTSVVTIFSARINWTEWGQENVGMVISRRLPCAGCALFHQPEECGKDFACITDIKPEEVFDAAIACIERQTTPS